MKNLLVVCGGQSPEHSISIRSAKNILNALDRNKYHITLIGITQKGEWRMIQEDELGDTITNQGDVVSIVPGKAEFLMCENRSIGKFDVVFPILHGPNGEDGTVQGLFSLLQIRFVGPGVLSSSIAMDKDVTKRLLQESDIKVAPWRLLTKGDKVPGYYDIVDDLGEVVFVKPANMGSSVGVHRVENEKEWSVAIADAFKYDRRVLVEQSIIGRELECAVLGNNQPKATGVGEVRSGDFYSFDEKYAETSDAEIIIPAEIDRKYLPALKETAIQAYKTLCCEGMSRVDMFLTHAGEIYVNEVNTIPGFTSISMYPKLWEEEGLGYSELLDQLIDLSIERG
ncbi:D-alanine--D-alanine ligase family protein [Ekhidna sp.]|uniref:D-alanine--D-alanine ligase family protein n=1 Tax=Ekhidna sp. TaxID=2608089 RepID=UPI003B5011B0